MQLPDQPGFSIADDDRCRRREWIVERVGWACMLAAIGAAVVGWFGHGLRGEAVANSPDARFSVRYDPIERCRRPGSFVVELAAGASPPGRSSSPLDHRLHVSRSLAQAVRRIVPEPLRVEEDVDGVTYVLRASRHVELQIEFDDWGAREHRLRLGAGPALALRQRILP